MDGGTASPLIVARDLCVRYGERAALDGLSFSVGAGEIVGLLGPNGAGKTTTLSVLSTLRKAETGAAEIAGYDVDRESLRVRRLIGLVPQNLAIYPTLTANENARFFARLFDLKGAAGEEAVRRALTLVGLAERAGEIVATFSGGMQRRLNLACGLLHDPSVMLLDEPTVGVDPQSRERIFEAVRERAKCGAAVLYSTHYMEEAEHLCHRVVLIDRGRVVVSGTPAALIAEKGGGTRLEVTTREQLPPNFLDGVPQAHVAGSSAVDGAGFRSQVTLEDIAGASLVLDRAATRGGGILDFRLHQPTLQEVFLRLTGHDLRDT